MGSGGAGPDRSPALSDWSTAGVFPASVRALVNGVLKAMFFSKLRTMASIVFALTVVAAGLGAAARVAASDPKDAVPPAGGTAAPAPGRPRRTVNDLFANVMNEVDTPWSLTLRDAIHIGLDNADSIRVIGLSAPGYEGDGFLIAPMKPPADAPRFKAEVMAARPFDRAAVLEPRPATRSALGEQEGRRNG